MKNILYIVLALLVSPVVFGQNFTEVTPSPFEALSNSTSAFADVDGDGNLDLFIAGRAVAGDTVMLYKNDGAGNFTEVTGNPFIGVQRGPAFDVADIDEDGDIDILITGYYAPTYDETTKLYLNDGTGQYTEQTPSVFRQFSYGTVNFADVDNDGDSDVLLTGELGSSPWKASKLYINDGSGNFTEQSGSPFLGTDNGVAEFADVDGNGSPDLFINGGLYINDGNGNFTKQTPAPFTFINDGDVAFADVDNDGDLDAVISGAKAGETHPIYTKLYLNDGNGNFTEQTGTPFTNLRYSAVAFSDINCDSSPDVYISGYDSNGDRHAEFFTNDGSGNFSLASNQPTQQFANGSISFGDVDGDADKDLLITGIFEKQGIFGAYNSRVTRLYTFDCTVVLPIELTTFIGKKTTKGNKLEWETASERNNDYFIISYSSNGKNWETIKKVSGAGNSSVPKEYQTMHYDFDDSINYYRLEQVDYDGKSEVFPIISIDNSNFGATLLKRTNTIGQEVNASYQGIVIEYYSDGKTIKKWNN